MLGSLALCAAALAVWVASRLGPVGHAAAGAPSPAASAPALGTAVSARSLSALRDPDPIEPTAVLPLADRASVPPAVAPADPAEGCILFGRVLDEHGAVLLEPAPVVRLLGPSGGVVATVTDPHGTWRVAGLEPGSWEVRAGAQDHLNDCRRIELEASASSDPVELRLCKSADLLVWLDPPAGQRFEPEGLSQVQASLRVRWSGGGAQGCASPESPTSGGSVRRPLGTLLEDGSFGLAVWVERARDHAGSAELVLGETVRDRQAAAPGWTELHLVLDVERAKAALRARATGLPAEHVRSTLSGAAR